MDYFLGTIMPWVGSWVPNGWLPCDGRSLPVQTNQALYSLIMNTYGGNNVNFNIPDLRGRMPIESGTAPNSTITHTLGQMGGADSINFVASKTGSITVNTTNMPAHSHSTTLSLSNVNASATTTMSVSTGANGSVTAPTNCQLSTSVATGLPAAGIFIDAAATPVTPSSMQGITTSVTTTANGSASLANTGNNQALPFTASVNTKIPAISPYTCVNFIICVSGLYPMRP